VTKIAIQCYIKEWFR